MKRKLQILFTALCTVIGIVLFVNLSQEASQELTSEKAWDKQIQEKRESKKAGSHKYDRPDEFALFLGWIWVVYPLCFHEIAPGKHIQML